MWHQFDNAKTCAQALATDIGFLLEKSIIEKDQAVLAVSGGRSPIPVFQELSKRDLDWSKVHIILVDERYVPVDHDDSNEKLVRQYLLQGPAARAHFTGLAHQTSSLDGDVDKANTQLPDADIVLLGMGDDGHMASLFAHAPEFAQAIKTTSNGTAAPRYARISPPRAPHDRISMTLAALQRAGCLFLEIAGTTRRDVYERAAMQNSPDYPISYVLDKNWPGARVQTYWHPGTTP